MDKTEKITVISIHVQFKNETQFENELGTIYHIFSSKSNFNDSLSMSLSTLKTHLLLQTRTFIYIIIKKKNLYITYHDTDAKTYYKNSETIFPISFSDTNHFFKSNWNISPSCI